MFFFVPYFASTGAGETLQGESNWSCICNEEAKEIRDASQRPGKLFPSLIEYLSSLCFIYLLISLIKLISSIYSLIFRLNM